MAIACYLSQRKRWLCKLSWLLTLAVFAFIGYAQLAQAATVKMSRSKICHDAQSPYYERVKNFTAYATLNACLADGGRLPKGQTRQPDIGSQQSSSQNSRQNSREYSRSAFAHWTDDDSDCLNTRHELLMSLSTTPVTTTDDGCRVLRGRWNDPYSGEIIFDAARIDIDHLVPLAWAWQRGAANWSAQERRKFANDPVNLFAVKLELNRSKGAQGPAEWLPPNEKFHCQYMTRYLRVMLSYKFTNSARESIRNLQQQICSNRTIS